MAAKKQTYEQAMKRLEEIVSRIDSNELDIDSLGVNLKEAQGNFNTYLTLIEDSQHIGKRV